ncbi:hypothetical protein GCM10010156_34990 [Planobispora rosea]|uniref:Secreted protein n=1 Tax=Planobispora rosea TaxID=35762 RepID=A0A8J3RYH7_PLARO|nr:hypothetical protein [Planobispora rosea]GGS73053.1 hypothetical protein GCM10010156_34990 [Planobispora rosea]GIH85361.1 hypothetical protein Pro02_37690 [Planobispora rosea]
MVRRIITASAIVCLAVVGTATVASAEPEPQQSQQQEQQPVSLGTSLPGPLGSLLNGHGPLGTIANGLLGNLLKAVRD